MRAARWCLHRATRWCRAARCACTGRRGGACGGCNRAAVSCRRCRFLSPLSLALRFPGTAAVSCRQPPFALRFPEGATETWASSRSRGSFLKSLPKPVARPQDWVGERIRIRFSSASGSLRIQQRERSGSGFSSASGSLRFQQRERIRIRFQQRDRIRQDSVARADQDQVSAARADPDPGPRRIGIAGTGSGSQGRTGTGFSARTPARTAARSGRPRAAAPRPSRRDNDQRQQEHPEADPATASCRRTCGSGCAARRWQHQCHVHDDEQRRRRASRGSAAPVPPRSGRAVHSRSAFFGHSRDMRTPVTIASGAARKTIVK